jgi:hypothetical protein
LHCRQFEQCVENGDFSACPEIRAAAYQQLMNTFCWLGTLDKEKVVAASSNSGNILAPVVDHGYRDAARRQRFEQNVSRDPVSVRLSQTRFPSLETRL